MNLGFSPGAVLLEKTLRELTWDRARTVAATNQGNPRTEQTAMLTQMTRRSKWYPHDFYLAGKSLNSQTNWGYFGTSTDLQLELLAVDDDRRDLLVHENQDGGNNGGKDGYEYGLHRIASRIH